VLLSKVRWWKEIRGFDNRRRGLGEIATQDPQHGPLTMRLDTNVMVALVFSKAKAFGIHTGMYELFDFHGRAGKRLSFTWISD